MKKLRHFWKNFLDLLANANGNKKDGVKESKTSEHIKPVVQFELIVMGLVDARILLEEKYIKLDTFVSKLDDKIKTLEEDLRYTKDTLI